MADNKTQITITAKDETHAAIASAQANLEKLGISARSLSSGMTSSFKAIGLGLAGIGAGVGLSTLKDRFDDVIASASRLKEMADVTGASVENLSGLAAVAKVTATDMALVETAINKLSKGMHASDEDAKGFGKALAFIGLKMEDLRGQDPAQNFLTIAKALDGLEDGTGKVAVGTALLGKQYTAIAGYMKDVAQSGDLVVKTTESQAVAAKNYEEDLRRLTLTKNALYKTVSLELAPAFDTLVRAMIGARNETNGVLSTAKDLAADGSIRQWGVDAVNVAGSVIDAFQGVARFFEITGKLLGATAAAAAQTASGNFASAGETFKEWAADRDKIVAQSYFSDRLKIQTDALQAHWQRVEQVKKAYASFPKDVQNKALKSLEESFYGEGRTRKGASGFVAAPEKPEKGAKEKDDYSKIIAALNEKIAVEQLNIDTVGKATAAEKDYAKFQADVASGAVKLTAEQQRVIESYYGVYIARQKDAKAADEFNKGVEKQTEAMQKQREALIDQVRHLNEEAELYGLTDRALAAVTVSRIEDAVATARQNGAGADQIAYLEQELALRREISEATDKKSTAAILSQTDDAKQKKIDADKALLARKLASGDITRREYEQGLKVIESSVDEMGEFMKQAARNMQDAFADFLFDPFSDGVGNMARKFGQAVQRMIAEAASAQLLKLLLGDMGKTGELGGLVGSIFKGIGGSGDSGWMSSSSWFANGGIMTSAGPLPLNKYAGGGIANRPQLALFGEGRKPEAYVPLPDGRRIPVAMSGGAGQLNQTLNFYGAAEPAQVKRAAASGARQVLGVASGARRYG